MKKYAMIVAALAVAGVAGCHSLYALRYEAPGLYENVEALTDNEVNKDTLNKMLRQAIWDTRLVYDPSTRITDFYCVTEGNCVCPISNP